MFDYLIHLKHRSLYISISNLFSPITDLYIHKMTSFEPDNGSCDIDYYISVKYRLRIGLNLILSSCFREELLVIVGTNELTPTDAVKYQVEEILFPSE